MRSRILILTVLFVTLVLIAGCAGGGPSAPQPPDTPEVPELTIEYYGASSPSGEITWYPAQDEPVNGGFIMPWKPETPELRITIRPASADYVVHLDPSGWNGSSVEAQTGPNGVAIVICPAAGKYDVWANVNGEVVSTTLVIAP